MQLDQNMASFCIQEEFNGVFPKFVIFKFNMDPQFALSNHQIDSLIYFDCPHKLLPY